MPHYGLFLWAAIRKPSAIFGTACESLRALTVCVVIRLYIFEYSLIIMLNAKSGVSTYLERSNRNLHISMVTPQTGGAESAELISI